MRIELTAKSSVGYHWNVWLIDESGSEPAYLLGTYATTIPNWFESYWNKELQRELEGVTCLTSEKKSRQEVATL